MPEPTQTTPTTSAPTTPPPNLGQSFDASFPDDGLDTPPEPPNKEAAGEVPPESVSGSPDSGKLPAKSKETDSSKSATSAEGSADSKTSGGKETNSSAESAGSEFSPPAVAKPHELRSFATRMGQRAQKAETTLAQLQARITQLEQQPPKQAEDNTALATELAAAKKQLAQYENDLRLTRYERSQEYQTKYQKPYQDAVARAYREVKELIAYEPNPEDPDTPRERAATPQDFDEIYSLPLGQATRLAKAKFGDAAMIVLQHRQTIRQLSESAYAAVEEYKTKASEVENETKAQSAQREAAMSKMFEAAREGHAKRSAELFSERNGDSEGNELLAKGRAFASAVFSGNGGLTENQVVFRDALAYNRLSAYPRILRDLKRAQTELDEAKKTIESLRGSGPGPAKPGAEKAKPVGNGDIMSAFDAMIPS